MPQPRLSAKLLGFAQRFGVLACALLLAAVPLAIHVHKYPDFASFWAGYDQSHYLQSARAWEAGDLNPAHHHYLPLYPLMGAAFIRLTPWQPFFIPDVACLIASLFLFIAIGRRLAPTWPAAALAVCFAIAALSGRTAAAIWVVPWSTTGSAPFQFASLLLALRLIERPTPVRAAALGAAIALIAGFRPSDAAILLATCGPAAAAAALLARLGTRRTLALAAAGLGGLLAGLAPTLAAHAAIYGFSPGPYIHDSASIGLEWRLLRLRWVMLVITPQPLLPEGAGMALWLPWLAPGIAGMVAALALPTRRPATFLVAATLVLHWAIYLSYRDLQPYGLWRFYNIHYFKWTFPFIALWAAQLIACLAHRPTRLRALAACFVVIPLFTWHPILRKSTSFPLIVQNNSIALPDGALRLNRAVQLPLIGTWQDIYFAPATIDLAGQTFANTRDFKLSPVPGGALILPLRVLPTGPATLRLPPGVTLTPPGDAEIFRQAIVFGF